MFSRLSANPNIHIRPSTANLITIVLLVGQVACSPDQTSAPASDSKAGASDVPDQLTADFELTDSATGTEISADISTGNDVSPFTDIFVCEPDCTGKQCGTDGCGGNCGVCDEGMKCTANRCEPLCLPNTSTSCQGKVVHWVDSCDAVGAVKETCSIGTECKDGQCVPCTPNQSKTCQNNDVVWQNSCGELGALVESCPQPKVCAKGTCTEPFSSYSGVYDIVVTPVSKSVTIGKDAVIATFPATVATIEIDASSAATVDFEGGNVPYSALGTLTGETKLDAAGTFTEEYDGKLIVHEFILSVLFQDQSNFAGTVKDLLFDETKSGPPTVIVRDITGTRIP